MSTIGNNILWHSNKETPSAHGSNVVLVCFSVTLRDRYDDAENPTPNKTILKTMSVGLRNRYKDAEQPESNSIVIKSMDAGYIGYPYQGSTIPYIPSNKSYDLIHHK